MRRIKRMMAVLMLAAVATLSAQTAFAGVIVGDDHKEGVILTDKQGVLLSDKDGVLVGDRRTDTKATSGAWDVVVVVINGLTGVILTD